MLVKFINRKTSLTQFSRFLDIKKTKLVNEGETAVLSCQVDAFPYNSESVSWFRDGYDIGKIILLYLFHRTMQTYGKMQIKVVLRFLSHDISECYWVRMENLFLLDA